LSETNNIRVPDDDEEEEPEPEWGTFDVGDIKQEIHQPRQQITSNNANVNREIQRKSNEQEQWKEQDDAIISI
jgi:hypothetical protein